MFGFSKKENLWEISIKQLELEHGISTSDLIDVNPVKIYFDTVTKDFSLSKEASISLYFRLAAFNFIAPASLMIDKGHNVDAEKYLSLIPVLNSSADWSDRAKDKFKLESATSKLNSTIEETLSRIGIRRG